MVSVICTMIRAVPRVLLLVPDGHLPRARLRQGRPGPRRRAGRGVRGASGHRRPAPWRVPLDDPEAAVGVIEALDDGRGVDAVVAVDDQGVVVAAAGRRPPRASRTTRPTRWRRRRDKRAMRERARRGRGRPTARSVTRPHGGRVPVRGEADRPRRESRRHPVRRRPRSSTPRRSSRIRAFWTGPLIVEQYVPGGEVAVEAILRAGELDDARGLRQARPARRPVLRGDDLRHAVALAPDGPRRRRAARRPGRRRDRADRRSGARRGPRRSTPSRRRASCSSRWRPGRSAGCARARCGSAPASRSRRWSCATRSAWTSATSSGRRARRA